MATKKKITKKAATKRKATTKKAAVKPKATPKKAVGKKKVVKPKVSPKKAAGKKNVTKSKASPKKAAGKKNVTKSKASPKKAAGKKNVTKSKASPKKATGKKKVVKPKVSPKKTVKKAVKRKVTAKKPSAALESVNPMVSQVSELQVGDRAPEFMTQINENEKLSLSDFRGEKVVLYFYPKDDTPGCTLEAQDFTANSSKFLANNTVVLGVSKDNLKSHCKFKEKYNLAHTLLADTDETICHLYGVVNRSTFLIDEEGVIVQIWRGVKVSGHVEEVLAAVAGKAGVNSDEPVQEELLVD